MNDYIGNNGLKSGMGSRAYQEDFGATGDFNLTSGAKIQYAVVCDGMGGMDSGSRASVLCCDIFTEGIKEMTEDTDVHQLFTDLALKADGEIYKFKDKYGNKLNSGTTLSAALIKNNTLYWVSIGDSRIYLFQGEKLRLLTRDHVYSMKLIEMEQNGELEEGKWEEHPQKNSLISYVGVGGMEMVDMNSKPIPLNSGDLVLVVSDGITKILSDNNIESLVSDKMDLYAEEIAEILVKKATEGTITERDNATAAILKVGGGKS